jgi:hypothetical protein
MVLIVVLWAIYRFARLGFGHSAVVVAHQYQLTFVLILISDPG